MTSDELNPKTGYKDLTIAGKNSKQATGVLINLYGIKNFVNNVDYVSLFAQKIVFQLIKNYVEKILTISLAKDVAYVQKYVHLKQ